MVWGEDAEPALVSAQVTDVLNAGAHLNNDEGPLSQVRVGSEESTKELDVPSGGPIVLGWRQHRRSL